VPDLGRNRLAKLLSQGVEGIGGRRNMPLRGGGLGRGRLGAGHGWGLEWWPDVLGTFNGITIVTQAQALALVAAAG
jgi:hypothetical protein